MNYLYEDINITKKLLGIKKDVPPVIMDNLNPKFNIREYQREAFENFLIYYENPNIKKTWPIKLLFHMATGSGKTLIMAGLILYLFEKGYRNFLFFVDTNNIITKTKENFLTKNSSKYLFKDRINIHGKEIRIREVDNFQDVDDESINICFMTIQKLHDMRWNCKENQIAFSDFANNKKIVFISDEAHHMNAMTRNSGLLASELNNKCYWEDTVNLLLNQNINNILLEFTATCDLENNNIKEKYLKRIIYNYTLKEFRRDKYSKEISTLRNNVDKKTRMLQGILLSQYRLKVFQKYRINIKPIILFKGKSNIADSEDNLKAFNEMIENLVPEDIEEVEKLNVDDLDGNKYISKMFKFFKENNISYENLVRELKEDFSKEKCKLVNENTLTEKDQIELNRLEDRNNHIRAIFEIQILDEGWDVLNLFDIVRLYETRDSKGNKPGKTTISEAQLIGRGARYCPFAIKEDDDVYKRKYDDDIDNELRICETLLYHCQNENRYISELRRALISLGIYDENKKSITTRLKESFLKEDFYINGMVFRNNRKLISKDTIHEVPSRIKNLPYNFNYYDKTTKSENILEDTEEIVKSADDISLKYKEYNYKLKDIYEINYNLILTAIRRFDLLSFDNIKKCYPNVKSMREFITSEDYLGNISLIIRTKETITLRDIFNSLHELFDKIQHEIISEEEHYIGEKEFMPVKINEIFQKEVTRELIIQDNDGEGISQNLVINDEYRLDLSNKDWYVYSDNFGTTEEKKFVRYFDNYVKKLEDVYDKIFLIRNERVLSLYSFKEGKKFEPDFILVLIREKEDRKEQYQIFIEPKGDHLIANDSWKEEFLLEIKEEGIPVKEFVDDKDYHIWGFPFYNEHTRIEEFNSNMNSILND